MAAEIIGGMAESHAKEYLTIQGAVDTGNLRNSVTHDTENGGKTVVIGSAVKYAPYIELGTYKMAARPYLRPAIEKHIDEYKSLLEEVLKGDT